jgi:hypothetical protein
MLKNKGPSFMKKQIKKITAIFCCTLLFSLPSDLAAVAQEQSLPTSTETPLDSQTGALVPYQTPASSYDQTTQTEPDPEAGALIPHTQTTPAEDPQELVSQIKGLITEMETKVQQIKQQRNKEIEQLKNLETTMKENLEEKQQSVPLPSSAKQITQAPTTSLPQE